MDDILISTTTKKFVTQYLRTPSRALLITGLSGVGKYYLAQGIASKLLSVNLAKLGTHPYYLLIDQEEDSISIDKVRDLQRSLARKVPGTAEIRRVIVIDNAQQLTIEAQNALLKTLEEIPNDTVCIVTAPNVNALLPTVVSRCTQLAVHSVSLEDSYQFFSERVTKQEITRAFNITSGRAGLMSAMLSDSKHPLIKAIQLAKETLAKSDYERLLMVDSLSKDKTQTVNFVEATALLARASLKVSITKSSDQDTQKWLDIVRRSLSAQASLSKNANPKLVLADLFINL